MATGCAGTSTGDTAPKDPQPAPRPIGGDRDAHGCLAPAGYTWCARERACVRPWELAKQAGFDNTAEGFAAHCSAADSTTTP
ncbi:MAG: peptidase [Xanthomonadales bacterium]|nr:peptidase [Xanthomonadales bacterium]